MAGDATQPTGGETWNRLRFDWNVEDAYCAYMSTGGQQAALSCYRPSQPWARMLLPDIYMGQCVDDARYGNGLTGDLPIFLGLLAFAIRKDELTRLLPIMMSNSRWQTYPMEHGREYMTTESVYQW
jgi:hypothetical protein